MPAPEIFLSYRRVDTGGHARALFEKLHERFPQRVFLDWEGIEPGEDFIARLEALGRSCRVLLALIGREWLSVTDAAGRQRIGLPEDHVRREIGRALERGIPVVPVLLDGAVMPGEADLPEALKALAARNALAISNANYASDIERLMRGIEAILGEEEATVIHAVRKDREWTSGGAFGRQVSVEFTITPKRKQIIWITAGVIVAVAAVLAAIAVALIS